MDKLVLFDIDSTLVKGSKIKNTIVFPEAFKKVYGIDTTIDIINPHGMTDQQIIIEVLKKKGIDEQTIKQKLKECIQVMVDSFDRVGDREEVIILEGVKELLEELDKHKVLMGLVTGNLESIARGKLKNVGINHYFKVGGFGSDDINRVNLVKIAIKRAEENFDFKSDDNVFLFGDSPQDVKSGKEAGVKAIGVTTGIYSKGQLEDAGADFVLDDMSNTQKIMNIIL